MEEKEREREMKFLTLRRGNSERPASAPNEFEESKLYDPPIMSLYEIPLTKLKEAPRGSDIGLFNPASS